MRFLARPKPDAKARSGIVIAPLIAFDIMLTMCVVELASSELM